MKLEKSINLNTISILLVLCLNYLGIGLVFPLFPQMCFETGPHCLLPSYMTVSERSITLGVLLSLMPLTQFFFSPLLGAWSDRWGRKIVLLKSLSVGCLGYFLGSYGITHSSLWLLFLSRILVGIATSNSSVVAATLADLSSKENRPSFFSYYGISVSIGMALGPFLGSFLYDTPFSPNPCSFPFIVAGGLTFCNLLSVFLLLPSGVKKQSDEKEIESQPENLFREKNIVPFFLSAFLFYFGWTFFWEFISVSAMYTMDYPKEEIGTIYAIGAASQVICGCIVSRTILVKIPLKLLLPTSLGALSLLVGFMGTISSKSQLFSLIVLTQLFLSCITPLMSTFVSKHASPIAQGKALGTLVSIKAAAYTLGPLLSGILFSKTALMPIIIGSSSLFLAFWTSIFSFRESSKSTI